MILLPLTYMWPRSWYVTLNCRNNRKVKRVIEISLATKWLRCLSNVVKTSGKEQCILDSCSISPNCQEPRVIIVGAGMAGLSAAHRLTQCGINNFLVLEAKER